MRFSFRFDEGCVYPVFGDENHVEQTVVENVNKPVLQELGAEIKPAPEDFLQVCILKLLRQWASHPMVAVLFNDGMAFSTSGYQDNKRVLVMGEVFLRHHAVHAALLSLPPLLRRAW